MRILDLFRSRRDNESPDTNDDLAQTVVDPDVFVDRQDPNLDREQPQPVARGPLDRFLRVDYEWYGYSEGYANPATDFLESKLRSIRTDFRLEVDRCLDDRRREIHELDVFLLRTSGITTRLEEELRLKLRHLQEVVKELEQQKTLSVDDEGMLASAVSRYRLGFQRGMERYLQEKWFAGCTGLFNK